MGGRHLVEIVDDLPHVGPFFAVGAREEAAFEAVEDDVAQGARVELEGLDRLLDFARHRGARHQAVVRAKRDRQPVAHHAAEGMILHPSQRRHGLHIRGDTHLERDAPIGHELRQLLHVAVRIVGLDLIHRKKVRAMADAVGV